MDKEEFKAQFPEVSQLMDLCYLMGLAVQTYGDEPHPVVEYFVGRINELKHRLATGDILVGTGEGEALPETLNMIHPIPGYVPPKGEEICNDRQKEEPIVCDVTQGKPWLGQHPKGLEEDSRNVREDILA